jgi:hypothetical protein
MLTSEHTDIVRDCALRVSSEGRGPLGLYERVYAVHGGIFSRADLWTLQFCAQEVSRQDGSAHDVSDFFRAFKHATERKRAGYDLDVVTLNELAGLIDPEHNACGRLRTSCLASGGVPAGSHPDSIGADLRRLETDLVRFNSGEREDFDGKEITAEDLYLRFRVIHPRAHGNSLEGAIIYNWLRDSLDWPFSPPKPARFRGH